jgi:hypothetical protein
VFPVNTINHAQQVVSTITNPNQVNTVILHLITNDVTMETDSVTASKMTALATYCCAMFPHARISISLGISRGDSELFNNRIWEVNMALKVPFYNHRQISLIDNDALSFNGWPNYKFLGPDYYHLSDHGTSTLASHLRTAIESPGIGGSTCHHHWY